MRMTINSKNKDVKFLCIHTIDYYTAIKKLMQTIQTWKCGHKNFQNKNRHENKMTEL